MSKRTSRTKSKAKSLDVNANAIGIMPPQRTVLTTGIKANPLPASEELPSVEAEDVIEDKPDALVVVHGSFGLCTFKNTAGGTPPKRFKGKHTWSYELEAQLNAYNASR